MSTDLETKLQKLRDIHVDSSPRAKEQIAEWEKSIKKISLKTKYAEMEVTIEIVKDAKRRILGINQLLQNDRKLTDVERAALFEKREVYEWYLKLLDADAAGETLKDIETAIDFELSA